MAGTRIICTMKDTLRILVSWKCNLRCPYCCNEQPRFRNEITPTTFEDVNWGGYENFCITGGEPLLNMDLVEKVCAKIPKGKLTILYTNGLLFNRPIAALLQAWGIQCVNVGLHAEPTFAGIIDKVIDAARGTRLSIRFHANEIYRERLEKEFPYATFRFWKMDDCDRGNEDRIVLKDPS